MKRKAICKAIIAIAVAMAFVMPVAAFANVGTIGVTSNIENTGDTNNIKNLVANDNSNEDDNSNEEIFTSDNVIEKPDSFLDDAFVEGPVLMMDDDFYTTERDDSIVSMESPVHNLDTGLNYTTIQGAIDAPETLDGHTILVDAGIYYENVLVTKSLALKGADRDTTIIDASGSGFCINIGTGVPGQGTGIANGASISDFTGRNGDRAAFRIVDNSYCSILNCTVYNVTYGGVGQPGIYVTRGIADNNIVKNCEVYNCDYGIYVYQNPRNTTIIDCNCHDNTMSGGGAYIWVTKNTSIINCDFYNNTGPQGGVVIHQAEETRFIDCNFYNNSASGAYPILVYSPECSFDNCNFYNNGNYGLYLYGSSGGPYVTVTDCNSWNNKIGVGASGINGTITGCNIYDNVDYGIQLGDGTSGNLIYNNYFDNAINAYDDSNNTWNISKTAGTNILGDPHLGGNYWSDYAGEDLDLDGLGDTLLPYNCDGNITNGGDYLPLVPLGYVYVDDNRPPEWYDATHVKTIQEGVDNATAGNTVYVYNGIYYEHVTVGKQLDLVAQSTDVIVDGSGTGNVFYININDISMNSFTVKNGAYGIYLDSSLNSIFTNLQVIDNIGTYGFYAKSSDFTSIIGGEYIRNGNSAEGGSGYNIYLEYSDHVIIDNVTVDDPIQGEAASCPFVYTWNGDEFEFIADIDVGKISRYTYEGGDLKRLKWEDDPFYETPIAPLQVDFYQGIESSQIQPFDGKYEIRYTEELDETSYADLLELWTVDHAPGVEIYPDWTYRDNLFTVKNTQPPISAIDHNGDDVLSFISEKDWNAWTKEWVPMEEDYINMTIDEVLESHSGAYITLKLGDWAETPENLKLVITENREKTKNTEIRQQWKDLEKFFKNDPDVAKLQHIMDGPAIQINESGVWTDIPLEYQRIIIPTINGVARFMTTLFMPRTYVLDLTGLEIPNNEIRYVYNSPDKKGHVDQIGVDTSPPQEVDITVLKPSYANLGYRGSTARGMQLLSRLENEYNYDYTYSEEIFDIDYSGVVETSPRQSGYLTRYGDVLPLIQSINDEYVTMAKGDELSLQFDYTAPEDGMERDFIFREFGYYKANSRPCGLTVEPLPFKDMTMYPYDESIEQYDYENHTDYIENYQTRFIDEQDPACTGDSAYGIKLYDCDNFMINDVSGSPTNFVNAGEYGIYIHNSFDGMIANSNFTDGWNYGILLSYSPNCNIINCNLYSNSGYGISFSSSSNSNIMNCNVYSNSGYGIYLYRSSNSNITGCNLYSNSRGIYLYVSPNSNIANCDSYNNSGYYGDGIYIYHSPNSNITNCDSYNNSGYGIFLYYSANCELIGNTIYDNVYNFGVDSTKIDDFYQDIDPSNTVNGKLIYYFVEQKNIILDGTIYDFGYLALISCTSITAKNADVSGMLIINTIDSTISNVDSYNSKNGVYLWRSSDNSIADCAFYNNKEYGIYSYYSPNNSITNCDVHDNSKRGIFIYYSPNNSITDCDVYNNSGPYGDGIYFYCSSNGNITNCDSYNNSKGIYVHLSPNCNIADCAFYNNPYGIYFISSPTSNITNCDVYNNNYGAYLCKSSKSKLRDNTIYDNTYTFGFSAAYISDFYYDMDVSNTVNGRPIWYLTDTNNFELNETHNFGFLGLISCTSITAKNSDVNGILIVNTTDSTIFNVSSHNSADGILLRYSSNCNITNCTSYNNKNYGIYIRSSSKNNITNCNVYNTALYQGIYLESSSNNNNIKNCNVYDNNQYGICLRSSSNNNLIHHNNLVNNKVKNAYDACSNTWDDGYPSGGNYWDDYSGVDLFHGPDQNISGSDGIGDTPYLILGGSNQDNYPLMMILDDIPPTITDVLATPEVQTTTDPVNITCMVIDNIAIDTVKVHVDGPEGFTLEAIMNEGYWYEYTYTTMGDYDYFIWANDTQGNIAKSDTYSFVITEFDKPISAVDLLSTWTKTVPFTVTATAYDPTFSPGVENVTLWYRYSIDGTDWTDWTSYGIDEEAPWSWSFTGSDGYYEFYSIAVDDVGNVEDSLSTADASTGLDTIKPVTTIILDGTMGENDWYVGNVMVTITASDALSGVESTWYSLDSGYWNIYTAPFTVSSDGQHTVEAYSFDIARNREDTKSMDFKIDKTLPVTEHEFDGLIGQDGWFVTDVIVMLTAEDITSDINYTMYNLNDGDWITYVELFVVTEDGDHTLYYYSVDLAGNIEITNEVEFKIEHDIVPPVTTHDFDGIMGDNEWFTSNIVVTLTAEDDSSGVDYTMYNMDDTEWQEYTGPILVTEDGEHTIEYYSVDKVENKEDDKGPFAFKIDQTDPTIELTWDKENSKLVADVDDETSGIAKVEFYVNGVLLGNVTEEPYEWEVTKPKKGDKGQAIVCDNAGNEAVSEEIDAVPQSQSQSSSSSSVTWPFSWLFNLW